MQDRAVDELTEDKIVLRFLHDALYYFLLNKGDAREHLQVVDFLERSDCRIQT